MKKWIIPLLLLCLALGLSACAEPESDLPEFILTYAESHVHNYPTALGSERFAQLVKERTNGKVGYIYIPDMGPEGLNEFARYFFA